VINTLIDVKKLVKTGFFPCVRGGGESTSMLAARVHYLADFLERVCRQQSSPSPPRPLSFNFSRKIFSSSVFLETQQKYSEILVISNRR